MTRATRLAPLFAVLAAALCAQTAPPASSAPASGSAPPAAPRRRAISPEAAAALAAAAPKYAPPPKPPEKKPEEELPDLREIDKPKNTIIRLPKFIVQEPRPPVFRERDLNTSKAFTDLVLRRYVSETGLALNRYTLPIIGGGLKAYAMQRYADDERLKNMADFADRANMVEKSDASAGLYIKREVEKTFLRTSDFGWQGNGPR